MTTKAKGTVTVKDARSELHVRKQLLRLIRDAVVHFYPKMIPGLAYTAEEILGPEVWDPRGPGGRRFMGRCFAWMERNRLLPIRRVTPIGKYPVRYAR